MIALRPARPDDDDFVRRVYASTRAAEMEQVPWTEADKADFVEMQYRAQTADYRSRFPNAAHSIIVVDGEDRGRIWVNRDSDEIRLLDITLLPEHRNRGTGAELIERLIGEAGIAGVPLRHSVFTANVDALRFYERLGFVVVEDYEMYVLMEWSGVNRPAR